MIYVIDMACFVFMNSDDMQIGMWASLKNIYHFFVGGIWLSL